MSSVPKRIRQHREKQGRSTYDVGASTGIAPQLISMYERGERSPKFENLVRLSAEYNDGSLLVDFFSESLESATGMELDESDKKSLNSSLSTILDKVYKTG